jgi:DNA-binding NtrC family response regulator
MTEQELRTVLYLRSPENGDDIEQIIRAAGWGIQATVDTAAARLLLDRLPIQIGVMRLDSRPGDLLNDYMEFLIETRKRMPWIALIYPEALGQAVIRDMIASFFYDYHTLPTNPEHLRWTLGHALGMARLVDYHEALVESDAQVDDIVGESPAMRALARQLPKVSGVDVPVLITGESGTGKELVVRAIHQRSHRASKPLVAVNCGALPPSLIQAELFGFEKGAFTGAQSRRIGRIEAANGGTLFLDEIGELSPELQVNLLRFLQESTIQRLGNAKELPVDVRVVAATNADLEKAVAAHRFRQDLYFRINVFRIYLPPLRERRTDIPLLAHHFLSKFSTAGRGSKGFTEAALKAMQEHPWPGNVRELMNRVHRALVMGERPLIRPEDLELTGQHQPRPDMPLSDARCNADKEVLSRVLKETQYNLSEAARRLKISRPSLYRLMERYGFSR